ncbi:MAG: hypothetical protein COB17_08510 [Sulfurimonas sp.]|nr:MAG: hypothetical protein COB17_08510 [Sulfurimonas sp.]
MEIKSNSNNVTINGNIKSVSDFQIIKQYIDSIVNQHKNITINITDSLSITSSVIGYLNKLVLHDSININMSIGNSQLIDLLNDLNLVSVFKVKKV